MHPKRVLTSLLSGALSFVAVAIAFNGTLHHRLTTEATYYIVLLFALLLAIGVLTEHLMRPDGVVRRMLQGLAVGYVASTTAYLLTIMCRVVLGDSQKVTPGLELILIASFWPFIACLGWVNSAAFFLSAVAIDALAGDAGGKHPRD